MPYIMKKYLQFNFYRSISGIIQLATVLIFLFISAQNAHAQCTADGGTLEGGPFEFCVDGIADNVSDITLSGEAGDDTQWVITDAAGNILGLPPMPGVVDFDEAGAGVCLIWNLSFEKGLMGLEAGNNVADLEGCFGFSNSITVVRTEAGGACDAMCDNAGGVLEGGPFEFCVDGVADMVSGITLTANEGSNNQWVITDPEGNILGLPPMPGVVDFDEAGAGVCLIWNVSYEDGLTGLAADGNIFTGLEGCYSISNTITVTRNGVSGGVLEGGPFEFCVDGVTDNVSGITLIGNEGDNSAWVITDEAGNILGLPPMPGVVDFDEAGAGVCLIWNISYADGLTGLAGGNNVSELEGCFALSNSITVTRNAPSGGEIAGLSQNIINHTVIANRASGTVSIINNDDESVLSSFDMPEEGEPMYVVYNDYNNSFLVGDYNGKVAAFDAQSFEWLGSAEAGSGVFHMWLSPNKEQLWVNNELDKTISVIDPNTLTTIATIDLPADLASDFKPHDVILMPDNSAAFVTVLGGEDEDYVLKYSTTTFEETARASVGTDPHVSLTDTNDKLYVASQGSGEVAVLNRSDLSEETVLNIPNAHGLGMNNAGTYLYVGNISDGGTMATYTIDVLNNVIVGDPVDAPFSAPHNYAVSSDDSKLFITHSGMLNDKVSIYELSPTPTLITSVTVGNNPFGLASYSFYQSFDELDICAGDMISDAFEVSIHGNTGSNSAWVITDEALNILALPPSPPFDLDGAGAGTCLIWHLSYEDGLEGLNVGENADALNGCYDLSNAIQVNRSQPSGGTLEGGPFEFCVDGTPDFVSGITLTGNEGDNSAWVITDAAGNILGLPPMPGVVDFDEAGAGVCLIWHLSYAEGLTGLVMGGHVSGFEGCYDLSNPITVVRTEAGGACDAMCENSGGVLEGGPFEFCVDGIADMVSGITLTANEGSNNQWVITDPSGNILGLPPMPGVVDFDEAGAGVCLIWNVSYEDGLTGLAADGNIFTGLEGCYSISNTITVTRNGTSGGVLDGGPFDFCVDGEPDFVSGITLTGNEGDNSAWVITDEAGNILGLPPMPGVVDFDGAGVGVCLIWNISYADGLTGLAGGNKVSELNGCYELSNSITVTRNGTSGGVLEGGPFEFCVDGTPDFVSDITLTGNEGDNSAWVITDPDGNILGLPPMPGVVDFDEAGVGVCLIWNLAYADGLTGLEAGNNVSDLMGCFSLSNSITVTRVDSGPLCITSTDNVSAFKNFMLTPNPASDFINLNYEVSSEQSRGEVVMYDLYGKVVFQTNTIGTRSNIEIPVDQLTSGTYIIRLRFGNDSVASKVVVMH